MVLGIVAAIPFLAWSTQDLFVRDQPDCDGLVPWGDRVLVLTKPPRVFDFSRGRVDPLGLPEGLEFLGMATQGDRAFFLAASGCGDVKLLEKIAEDWDEKALPYPRRIGDETATAIAADQDVLVVLVSPRLYRFEAGEWRTTGLRRISHDREGIFAPLPGHALLLGRRLFLGYARGEWGGDLVAIDIDSGELVELGGMNLGSDAPVSCLTLDRRGQLWAVRGLSHLELSTGALYRLDGDRWTLIAGNEGLHPEEKDEDIERAGDWSLPLTSFEGVAFDRANRAYLLADHLGLLRQEAPGGWTRVTPSWPDHAYVNGLVLQERTAVLGTGDAGLVLVDLADGSMRLIDLR